MVYWPRASISDDKLWGCPWAWTLPFRSVPFTGRLSCRASISDDKLWGMSLGLDPPLQVGSLYRRAILQGPPTMGEILGDCRPKLCLLSLHGNIDFLFTCTGCSEGVFMLSKQIIYGKVQTWRENIEDLSKAFPLRRRSPRSGG